MPFEQFSSFSRWSGPAGLILGASALVVSLIHAGPVGPRGAAGSPGPQGQQGIQGKPGPAGKAGTSSRTVYPGAQTCQVQQSLIGADGTYTTFVFVCSAGAPQSLGPNGG